MLFSGSSCAAVSKAARLSAVMAGRPSRLVLSPLMTFVATVCFVGDVPLN